MELSREEYLNTLARKITAGGALFFNNKNELLLVKPNYKDNWNIPGGVTEAAEAPWEACQREVMEEIGLNRSINQLLCIDHKYVPEEKAAESLQFIFYGGVLTEEEIAKIKLQDSELTEFRFVPMREALKMVSQGMARRLPMCEEAIRDGQTRLISKMEESS
ncbi:MAG: NUDIX hydrolase [Candidatus Berkelbacteria bacterium]|nr:NUDIX hydrolase [Candidatus Berkelbacteria bacterium]